MIRRRLVLAVSAVAALAVLLGGWVVLVVLEDRLVDNLDRDFRDGTLSAEVRDVVARRDGPLARGRDRFDPVRDIAVVIYDDTGTVLDAYAAGRVDDPAPLPDAGDLAPSDGLRTVPALDGDLRYRAATLAANDGARVVIARSMATIDQTLTDARRVLGITGILATGTIAVLSWVLIRRAFAPIDRMIATADHIAAGTLTERTRVGDDRSEVGRLGAALDAMLDRIEQAVDDKSASEERMRRFVAEASHELRTPLTSVRGYAELYRQGAHDEASVATSMARIEAEAARMSSLVEDLLLLARLDREPSARSDRVDLAHVVAESVDAVRVVDGDRTWDLDLPSEPTPVAGDAGQLRQVLDNLLTNARVHTPAGTAVHTTVRVDGDRVRVQVDDDGPGIPAADRARAFDRFWRGTRSDENRVAGTGLGLAIARSIVESHGGDVAVEPSARGGTLVVVALPVHGTARTPSDRPDPSSRSEGIEAGP